MRQRLSIALMSAALLVACDEESGTEFDAGPRIDEDAGDVGADAGPGGDAGPGCVDQDDDGFGDGCAAGPDCDDADDTVNPDAPEVCNGVDDDCDEAVDEGVTAPSCALSQGVCAGATARCGASGFLECDATDYGADYEADETACDGLDNDCDGTTDEGCPCTDGETQVCGSDVGQCMEGTQTCAGGSFGLCDGEVAPMGEVCDGLDNDCDGMSDEAGDLTPPACPLQLGVCAGSTRTCGGGAGWLACDGTASYGGDYQPTETLCDGLDNDCDGAVDPGCACIDGTTQACGSSTGACTQGVQTCVSGAFGGCVGEVTPTAETCDGTDEDCDGMVDEALAAPACALTLGVCAGATQACSGAGGFTACDASSYGPNYEATESSCDGRDNDCDGMTDEGCPCVVGTTQTCGIAVGACSLGTQTCEASGWGPCTGNVDPTPETCNGADDDCNGVSDDGLTPPPCALIDGVCAGATQTCGGAAGWQACSGTASYGARYVMAEDGSADEAQCDGLDNDCNGTVDDMCASGPLVSGAEDFVAPALYHRNLVYSVLRGGNFEIVYENLDRGTPRQLTMTSEDELFPSVSGDRIVFLRGTGAARRAVLYDLTTDTETVLSSAQTSRVDIAGPFVVWDELTGGTQWDVFVRDLSSTGPATNLGAPGTSELSPSVRGGVIAWTQQTAMGTVVALVDQDPMTGAWNAPILHTPTGTSDVSLPLIDFEAVAWSDARGVSGTPTLTSDWDVYAAPFAALGVLTTPFPGENVVASTSDTELLRGLDSRIYAIDQLSGGDWNVAVGVLGDGGGPLVITSSTATQVNITGSGSQLVWQDNRLGSFDIFQSFFGGGTFRPGAGTVVIAEVLADPAPGADPNGDGTASTTADEFVELINFSSQAVALDGLTLSDATGVRHTFPPGTWIPALGSVVVFAGGTPSGTFGGARVQVASSGALGLNNAGDTVTLTDPSTMTVIDTFTYGSEGGMDQSIVPDTAGSVLHSTLGTGAPFSPGVFPDGFVP